MGKIVKDYNPNIKIDVESGISNPYYKKININEDLSNDIKTLQKVFEIFNKEFFDGDLDVPVISISGNMRADLRVTKPEHWYKRDIYSETQREEECIGLYLSEKIYFYDFKEVCVTLLKAMIMQYDIEQYAIYGSRKGKGAYKRMITNNNNYFSKAYAQKCWECGLNAEPIKKIDEETGEEVNIGKYTVTPAEKFDEVYVKNELGKLRLVLHKKKKKVMKKTESNNGQSMKVYECPSCGLSIRVTRKDPVNIKCYNDEKCANGVRFILRED